MRARGGAGAGATHVVLVARVGVAVQQLTHNINCTIMGSKVQRRLASKLRASPARTQFVHQHTTATTR